MLATKRVVFSALAVTLLASAPAHAAKLTTLYSFKGGTDGATPYSGMTYHAGVFYGTTYGGGTYGNGTIFKLEPASGTVTILYSFQTSNNGPGNPSALLSAKGSYLYGSADTVDMQDDNYDYAYFKYNITTGALTTLYVVPGPPWVTLTTIPQTISYTKDGLYATMVNGGGAVIKFNPRNGRILDQYDFSINDGHQGQLPSSPVIESAGFLYGTTVTGGTKGYGVFYKLDAVTGAETVIHDFGVPPDGYNPIGPLAYAQGMFYGATSVGNVVYALNPATGAETVFNTTETESSVTYKSGYLYLTGATTISRLKLQSGIITTLHTFTGGADGKTPAPGLVELGGSFYGTTESGGANGNGTVFKLTP
jgi:uncharacterized repeat protein (TIGR03803 family)